MTVKLTSNEQQQWIRTVDRATQRPLYVAVPSRTVSGKFHLVSSAGCDCRGFAYRGRCSHFDAVTAEAQRVTSALQKRISGPDSFRSGLSIGGRIGALERARLVALADSIWGMDGEGN